MNDPIKALIAAAQLLQEMWDNADRWTGPKASSHYRSAIHERMRAVFAAAEARPEPAAEPSIIPALRKVAVINCDGDTSRALDLLCDAVEALAREVRR